MSIKRGEITTKIIKNGLVFNMDAANRASTIPSTSTTKTFNTIDTSISGAFSSNAQWEGPITASFTFDGADDLITCSPSNIPTGAVTVSCWLKTTETTYDIVFTTGYQSSGVAGSIELLISSGKARFRRGDNSSNEVTLNSSNTFNDGNWHNITLTDTHLSNGMRVYIDGSDNSSSTSIGSTSFTPANGTFLYIAGQNSFHGDFKGNLACMQVYNRALSAEEVLYNYNGLKSRFGL